MTLSKSDRLSIILSAAAAGHINLCQFLELGDGGMRITTGVCPGCIEAPGDCEYGAESHYGFATVDEVLAWLGYR